jgi:hypothetical protein
MKNQVFLCIFILGSILRTHAQDTPDKIIHTFFMAYKDAGSDKAIDYLFSTNKILVFNKMRLPT